ncbi:THO complex subunit 1, putative [Chondrus crispus]|uniref:THO complex subunit 1, putative n=1 Tax=Chondrus crispus TaxID=2769 RepID=S0F2Z6_CHOCR|nr:THO complex subunit 1, putative [Chondrus crispus]CDF77546.1 THO complex subunit 1, putative [Chondrus crispus]|eukprot:XP_005717330.1 THO complex subunit 1, putative [Chondrus crispus]
MNAMHGALISLLVAPKSNPESVATQLHEQSQEYSPNGRGLLERVLKRATVDILKGGIQEPSDPKSAFSNALAIVDCAVVLMRNGHVEERLPWTLLEFVFSSCTRGQLSSGIGAIRERFDSYRRAATTAITHVYVIKAAMSCINRDQHGSDPLLSGRLRLILAAALPVWHPSGLNRRGHVYDGGKIDLGSEMENTKESDFDAALYKAFWGVQEFMQNPSLAENEDVWNTARVAIERILDTFETISTLRNPSVAPESPSPKYMAAPSLLHLQLVDVRARRHVLIQLVIFLHYLEVIGQTAPSEKTTPSAYKKHGFCKSLFESDGKGTIIKGRVYALLDRDCPGKFKRFVVSLLQRERKWIDWKKRTGYKHLNAPRSEAPKEFKRRRVLSPVPDSLAPDQSKRRPDGPEEWELRQAAWTVLPKSERIDPLRDPTRLKVSSIQDLKTQLQEDMEDPDITDDLKRIKNPKFVWRSLRLLCEESISTLLQITEPLSEHGVNLERCLAAKDVPAADEETKEAQEVKPDAESKIVVDTKIEAGAKAMEGVEAMGETESATKEAAKPEKAVEGLVASKAHADMQAKPKDGALVDSKRNTVGEDKQAENAPEEEADAVGLDKADGDAKVDRKAEGTKETDMVRQNQTVMNAQTSEPAKAIEEVESKP